MPPDEKNPKLRQKDLLEGITLKQILEELIQEVGWADLAKAVPVRCFMFDPTLTSSLKFLRRTPWARQKVEEIYRIHREAQGF